jgi:hypothetical protein
MILAALAAALAKASVIGRLTAQAVDFFSGNRVGR